MKITPIKQRRKIQTPRLCSNEKIKNKTIEKEQTKEKSSCWVIVYFSSACKAKLFSFLLLALSENKKNTEQWVRGRERFSCNQNLTRCNHTRVFNFFLWEEFFTPQVSKQASEWERRKTNNFELLLRAYIHIFRFVLQS